MTGFSPLGHTLLNEAIKHASISVRHALSLLHGGLVAGYFIPDHGGEPFEIKKLVTWTSVQAEDAARYGRLKKFRRSEFGMPEDGRVFVRDVEFAAAIADNPDPSPPEMTAPLSLTTQPIVDATFEKGGGQGRAGRKPKVGVDAFWIEIFRLYKDEEAASGGEYVKVMAQWCSENMQEPYEEDTVRRKIKELFKAIGWRWERTE